MTIFVGLQKHSTETPTYEEEKKRLETKEHEYKRCSLTLAAVEN